MTIDFPPEIEDELREAVERQGVHKDTFVIDAVSEKLRNLSGLSEEFPSFQVTKSQGGKKGQMITLGMFPQLKDLTEERDHGKVRSTGADQNLSWHVG